MGLISNYSRPRALQTRPLPPVGSFSVLSLLSSLFVILVAFRGAAGQNPAQDQKPPTGTVVRFTPEMAHALAGQYTRNMLIKRYELDPAKADQATAAVARRMMVMAHQVDSHGADFLEYVMSQQLTAQAEGRLQAGITPELGKGMGERLLPMMPALRDLIRDVSGDVRPLLSFKQQLKLTGDVAMAGTAINAFEQNMQRWAKGQAQPFENPFSSEDQQAVQKDASGLSKEAQNAQKSAKASADSHPWNSWKQYVEDARKLYAFDPSQSSTAESLLREYTSRAETAAQDAQRRDQVYRNRLWHEMLSSMHQWQHVLREQLDEQRAQLDDPIAQLSIEFKTRIDQIPTTAQRTAADEHMNQFLAERGIGTTEPTP